MFKIISIFFLLTSTVTVSASTLWEFYEKTTNNEISQALEKEMHSEAIRCTNGDNIACLTLGVGSFADSAWRVRELLTYFTPNGAVKKNLRKNLKSKIKNITPKKNISRSRKWGKGNINALSRRKIGNYTVEVHVDGNGPHIHLDRGSRNPKYIGMLNSSDKVRKTARVLSLLPKKLRENKIMRSAILKAKILWRNGG